MSSSPALLVPAEAAPCDSSDAPFIDAIDHLLAELAHLDLALLAYLELLVAPTGEPRLAARRDALAALQAEILGAPEPRRLDALRASNERRVAASAAAGRELPLAALTRRLALDWAERGVLLLALAPHVDRRYEPVFAYLQGDPQLTAPRLDLALQLLGGEPRERLRLRERLAPTAPLRRHGLVELLPEAPGQSHLLQTLTVTPRVLRLLLDQPGDEPIVAAMRPPAAALPATEPLLTALSPLAEQLLRPEATRPIARVTAEDPLATLAVFTAVATALQRPLLALDLTRPAAEAWPAHERLQAAFHEATLTGALLVLIDFETLTGDDLARLHARVEHHQDPLVLIERSPGPHLHWSGRPLLALQLSPPDRDERRALWRHFVAGDEPTRTAIVEHLADTYRLGASQIRDAARTATDLARLDPTLTPRDALARAARIHSAAGLTRLIERVEPFGSWDQLVLPPESLQQCRELLAAVHHRERVLAGWGSGRRGAGGLVALFAGPSGTGKTLTASLVARQLGHDLLRVDLAGVVSKYIGETEKQLEQVFRAAHRSNSVLFFDEADALFGKRTEVRDAHDRYANIETSYLLQRIEDFPGVVLLATNLKRNLDEAFLRRMYIVVEFPAPDRDRRLRLWRTLLPRGLTVAADLDLEFLAEHFELTGGNIRNVLHSAATLAAADGLPLAMIHLLLGVRRELHKLGRVTEAGDYGPYHAQLQHALEPGSTPPA